MSAMPELIDWSVTDAATRQRLLQRPAQQAGPQIAAAVSLANEGTTSTSSRRGRGGRAIILSPRPQASAIPVVAPVRSRG